MVAEWVLKGESASFTLKSLVAMADSPVGSVPRRKIKNTKLIPLQEIPSPPSLYGQTASKQIQHKRDLIDAARRLNPALVHSAPSAFWSVESSLKSGSLDDTNIKQQITIIENGVNYSTKRYNELRATNKKLTKDLKIKLDTLKEEKKNFEDMDALLKAETQEGQRIETIQEEIEKVESDIFRKSHYTRQLEHMLLRLQKNQLKFDVHMTGMEDVMRSIRKEGQDVRLLRRTLDLGLAKAISVLEVTQTNLAIARKDREVAMAQRRTDSDNALTLQEWMRQRELENEALAMELRGDLTKEEESFLRAQIIDKLEKTKSLQRANEESNKHFLAMEEALSQLKQITGVSSLADMHEKFCSQKGNKANLLQEVRDAEARLEAVKAGQLRHEQTFLEMQSSGSNSGARNNNNNNNNNNYSSSDNSSPYKPLGSSLNASSPSHSHSHFDVGSSRLLSMSVSMGGSGGVGQNTTQGSNSWHSTATVDGAIDEPSREASDHLEATIAAAKSDCKVARAAYDRLSAVLLTLQQGANGLLLRVQPYLHLSDTGVFDLTQPADDSQPWADTLENLSAGEQVLSKMMEVLSGTTEGTASPTNKWMAVALDEEEEDEMSIESRSIGTVGEAPSYAFNVRIKSRKTLREIDQRTKGEREESMPIERVKEKDKDRDKEKEGLGANIDDDDDAISLPHSIFGDRTAGQRAPGVRTPGVAPSASMAATAGKSMIVSAGAIGVGLETGVAVEEREREREREPVGKVLVPTRLTVKKASTRAQQEAKRASDLAVRSRRLNERMRAGVSQPSGGEDRDSAIGNIAMLRAQKAMAERLSTVGRCNLPEGIMLHDDPMSKTNAFLSQMPALT